MWLGPNSIMTGYEEASSKGSVVHKQGRDKVNYLVKYIIVYRRILHGSGKVVVNNLFNCK